MKIWLINMGKTAEPFLAEGVRFYEKRIRHYVPFEIMTLQPRVPKNLPVSSQKFTEGRAVLAAINRLDLPVLLDEKGKQMDSVSFSDFIQQTLNRGVKNLGFITGGSYGFSDEVYESVSERISLSSMTFSHQLIRLVFLEQLYRGFTILKGEPYHHG